MNNNLRTGAGQTESQPQANQAHKHGQNQRSEQKFRPEQVDAINQVFALLKLNYHNQFYKAFSSTQDLNAIKRLWLESLSRFDPTTILQAVKKITENHEFLPTLATIIKGCDKIQQQGLPEVHTAYLEACRAPSPKANYAWSHLAVYYAGKNADWYFLQNNPENIAFPIFKSHYQDICERLRSGEQLQPPTSSALPENKALEINNEENKKRLSKLRKALDL